MHDVTNISNGFRGLHTSEGLVTLDPGQTLTGVTILADEIEDHKKSGDFEIVGHRAKPKDEAEPAAPADEEAEGGGRKAKLRG